MKNSTPQLSFNLILLIFLLISNIASAQNANSFYGYHKQTHQKKSSLIINTKNSIVAPPFFTENFASGIPGNWTNVDNAGNGVQWTATTTGAYNTNAIVDAQLNPLGTSALNGYVKIDSDSAGFGVAVNAALKTVAISCAGHSAVRLSFNEYFAQYGASTGTVAVSNNNSTWTNVHSAESGLLQDSSTANPNAVDVDISSVAANQATVYIRFTYVGNFDYWWFIDDIQLYEPSATDLAANTVEDLYVDYTKIPVSQSTSLIRSGSVKNAGINTANGGTAQFEIINANTAAQVFTETINLTAVAPGANQTITSTAPYVIPSAGSYKSKLTVNIAGDGNSFNNSIESSPVAISDSVYSRDDGIYESVLGVGAGQGENGMAGPNFYINIADELTSVSFFLRDTFSLDPLGTPIYFSIHPQANSNVAPGVAVAYTDTLIILPGTIPAGGGFFTLPIHGGAYNVSPGLYFVGFHEDNLLLPMGYSLNNYRPGSTWVYFNSNVNPPGVNGWAKAEDFGFFVSYMIRLNFGNLGSGISETDANFDFNVYPNPSSNGFYNVQFSDPSRKYLLEVMDLPGQLLFKAEISNSLDYNLNLSSLANGIFWFRVSCDGLSTTRQIIIAR